MNTIKNYCLEHLKIVFIGIIILILIIIFGIYLYYHFDHKVKENELNEVALIEKNNENKIENTQTKEKQKINIDLKGAVNNPGVYKVEEGTIINDVINLAGGLAANATVKNINLSLKVTNEMVIVIYTDQELEGVNKQINDICYTDTYDISNCLKDKKSVIKSNSSTTSNKDKSTQEENSENTPSIVSINSATKEQLMTLTGIGEAKANNIISYREEQGGFKSLDELMNVKGIGEAIFNKIKDYITL